MEAKTAHCKLAARSFPCSRLPWVGGVSTCFPGPAGAGAGAGVRKPTALHSAACKTQRSALKTGSLFSPFPSPHWTNNTVLFAPQELNKPLSGE